MHYNRQLQMRLQQEEQPAAERLAIASKRETRGNVATFDSPSSIHQAVMGKIEKHTLSREKSRRKPHALLQI